MESTSFVTTPSLVSGYSSEVGTSLGSYASREPYIHLPEATPGLPGKHWETGGHLNLYQVPKATTTQVPVLLYHVPL